MSLITTCKLKQQNLQYNIVLCDISDLILIERESQSEDLKYIVPGLTECRYKLNGIEFIIKIYMVVVGVG